MANFSRGAISAQIQWRGATRETITPQISQRAKNSDRQNRNEKNEQKTHDLMAAATSTAATATDGRRWSRLSAAGTRRTEHRKLDGGLFTGTLGAGNLLLLVQHNFFELLLALIANILVNGHR
jgi:hypothetical protein